MKLILFLENQSILILKTYYNLRKTVNPSLVFEMQKWVEKPNYLCDFQNCNVFRHIFLTISELSLHKNHDGGWCIYRKADCLVNSGAFHHGERFANQHLISSIFSPSQLIIAAPHNCFFLYEGRRKIFAQSNHPIVCNFYSGEFLPLTNKQKNDWYCLASLIG